MAVGKWKVFSQMIEDEKNYIVGRVKDDTKPVHSGNVEYLAGHGYTTDREYCERMAKALNGEFEKPAHKKSYGQMMAEMITGTDEQALRIADCIEKMLDTEPNSVERLDAKKELVKALLRK